MYICILCNGNKILICTARDRDRRALFLFKRQYNNVTYAMCP